MIIGYLREGHENINYTQQKKTLQQQGCEEIVVEGDPPNQASRTLDELVQQLNEGDKVVVIKLGALADSLRSLAEILAEIHLKGAFIQSIEEEIDTSQTVTYDLFDLVKSLADFQRDTISEKTRKGIDEAKNRGASTGRPRKPDENVKRALGLYESKKYNLKEIKEQTGISKSTLYRYLDRK